MKLSLFFVPLLSLFSAMEIQAQSVPVSPEVISFTAKADNMYYTPARRELYYMIDLKAQQAPVSANRTPLNLSLVLDRSGSMSGDKISYARQAANFLINNLEPTDNLSLVIYDDKVDVLSASAKVSNKAALQNLVKTIDDRGSTNLSGGMLEGYAQAKTTYDPKMVNRVLLLSDGLANVGITENDKIMQIAKQKTREEGISVSTFGIGADFNELLMTGIAENANGNYYFIDSPDKIPAIFAQELKGLLSVVGQNLKLKVTFPQELRLEKVFGFPYQIQNNEVTLDLKDIFSAEQKTILFKFATPQAATNTLKIQATLTFDNASNYQRETMTREVVIFPTSDKFMYEANQNKDVLQNVVLMENNERMEEIAKQIDKGEYEEARKELQGLKTQFESQTKELPNNADLSKQKQLIMDYENQMKGAESMSDMDKKVMQKTMRSTNYSIRKKK